LYQPEARAYFGLEASQQTAHEHIVPFSGPNHKFLKVLIDSEHMSATWNANLHSHIPFHHDIVHAKGCFHDLDFPKMIIKLPKVTS
jgi:hypothetical protein